MSRKLDIVIETDASTTGWEQPATGSEQGDPGHQKKDINCLERLAAALPVKCFAKGKTNILIHLKINNSHII